MNRNGTALLTGTLLVSLWLAPGPRLARDTGAALPANANSGQTSSASEDVGAATRDNGAGKRERSLADIRKEGEDEYNAYIQRVITQACQTRDYQTDDEKEQVKQERQDEQDTDAPGCRVPRNFIIALVPDPVHTHLALLFDRTIDVIEEAAQDDGYMFDRAIMPWDAKTHTESTDYESRLKAEAYQRGKEEYPGLIAFRGSEKRPHQRLFVLAVAETPTGGIRKRQFLNAIKVIQDATGIDLHSPAQWNPDTQTEPGLRILGPTFSGSLDSLARILACNDGEPCYPMVSIHSGSVSSRDDILKFDEREQKLNIHFVSLHETDEVMIDRLIHFLSGTTYEDPDYAAHHPGNSDRGYAARDIAILSEDETAYGESGNAPEPNLKIEEKRRAIKEYCDPDSAKKDDDPRLNHQCFLKLYFPREISQLRAAYQDSLAAPSPGDARTPPRDTLPSNFFVPGSDDDTAPSYSSKQMPLSQESIMLDVVSELQRHHIKFIILRATDPIDALFLSRFLRTEYPQGRVVIIDADMLLRREAEDPRLHGVMALTTYSLAPSAGHNFATFERGHVERIFPGSNEVGTYNAMLLLLDAWVDKNVKPRQECEKEPAYEANTDCRHELAMHPPSPDKFPQLYQYGWLRELDHPQQYEAPPVRLLALGRDDFWPIAALGPYDKEPPTTLPRVNGQIWGVIPPPEVPNSWRLVQAVGILLGLGFSFSIWRASVFATTQANAKFAPAALDGRAALVLLAGLAQVQILLILRWPTVKNANAGPVNLDHLLEGTLALVIFCTAADLISRTRWASRRTGKAYIGWLWVGTFLVVSALSVSGVFLGQPAETPGYVVRYGTIRAMRLTSGLSFIMPTFFFLTVWLWWTDHTAAGYALLDHRHPKLPKGMTQPDVKRLSKSALPALQGALHLKPAAAAGYAGLLIIFFFGFWWLGNRPHPLLSLERPVLQRLMSVFFTLALGSVILATGRLWGIWLGVRKLLLTLDSLPLRRGFEGIIKDFSWKPVWRIGAGSLDEFQRIFAREKEALTAARNTYPFPTGNLDLEWEATMLCAQTARSFKHPYLSLRSWWKRREAEVALIRQFGKYQLQIARLTGRALDFLAEGWAREGKEAIEGETLHARGMRAWERCVCMVYVNFLLVMLVRIRTLIVAIGGMYVLTMIGITQYPFEPKAAIQVMLIVLLVCIVMVVGLVFAQIHRDATLSHITGTNPGELGIDFYFRMASFTALPLFSLLASQFPSVNRFFYSWLQPAIQAFNR